MAQHWNRRILAPIGRITIVTKHNIFIVFILQPNPIFFKEKNFVFFSNLFLKKLYGTQKLTWSKVK